MGDGCVICTPAPVSPLSLILLPYVYIYIYTVSHLEMTTEKCRAAACFHFDAAAENKRARTKEQRQSGRPKLLQRTKIKSHPLPSHVRIWPVEIHKMHSPNLCCWFLKAGTIPSTYWFASILIVLQIFGRSTKSNKILCDTQNFLKGNERNSN